MITADELLKRKYDKTFVGQIELEMLREARLGYRHVYYTARCEMYDKILLNINYPACRYL